jgi:outer membrane protein OmpA-like peptidoglycan-associated protein
MNKTILCILFCLTLSVASRAQENVLEATDTESLLECIITDADKIPEANAAITIESTDKKFSRKGTSGVDGKFYVLVPEGKKYNIKIRKFGKDFYFQDIDVPHEEGAVEYTRRFRIQLIKFYVRTYTLDNVYFDTNKSELKASSTPALQKLYESFFQNPNLKAEIAGHTDHVGDDEANMRLSQERADAVRNYLIEKGISGERILAKGYGETAPIAPNTTEAGRAKNRRTEVKVIEE